MLRARQLRFVCEYLVDCNATRAAIAAGYTKRTASQAGWEVLRNPKVAAEISRRQKRMADRHEVSADNVISELSKIGFANLADFYTIDAHGRVKVDAQALADPAKAAAIASIEVIDGADGGQQIKIKLADKRSALNDLGKHLGLFNERHEVALTPSRVEDDEPDSRRLAMAVLALLAEANHDAQAEPKLIEAKRAPDEGEFDLDL